MAVAAAGTVMETLPKVLAGIDVASNLIGKYSPKLKKVANMALSIKPKSIIRHIKKGGIKGVFKGIGKGVKGVSKFITSGKGLRAIQDVASDVGQIADIAGDTGIISQETHGKIRGGISEGLDRASSVHQTLENYNEEGKGILQRHTRGEHY